MLYYQMIYIKSSPFALVAFLKNLAKGETSLPKVKILQEKVMLGNGVPRNFVRWGEGVNKFS